MALSHSPSVVTDGLVLCLDAGNPKSYPGSGTVWTDLSGRANHVTLVNSPTYSSANGGVITFDGINDCANTTNTLNLSGTNAVTVFYFMKVNEYSTVKIIHELSANYNNFDDTLVVVYASTELGYSQSIFANVRGNSGYNIGVYDKSLLNGLDWCSLCVVHDTSQTSKENLVYKNTAITGELANPLSGHSADNTNNFGNRTFYIGSRGNTSFFASMSISCMMLYNRRLNEIEIAKNFNALRGRFGL